MLRIRPVWKADELKRFAELEKKYHYMGETHSGGDTLRVVIEDDGEWVAIMVWGGACYHLLRRDEYIGWSPALRAQRLKLVASNRRFTMLAKPGERKNLASQCLALAARNISALWMRRFHYRPLLAETFCDVERSAGTKADEKDTATVAAPAKNAFLENFIPRIYLKNPREDYSRR